MILTTTTTITSWSSGWQEDVIPNGYTDGGVDNFRFTDTVSSSNTPKAYAQSQDIPVGICYLDKGFCVITHPTLNSSFQYSAGTNLYGNTSYTGYSSGFTQIYFNFL